MRRHILKNFVQKIEIGNEKGRLYYTFPLYALALDDVISLENTPGAIRTRTRLRRPLCSTR